MFGKNEITAVQHDHDGLTLPVMEVFPTIQGEGPNAGCPATFVRLGGCNLRCWFCDTDFDLHKAEWSDVDILAEQVRRVSEVGPLVVLTGGEPLVWNLRPLFVRLTGRGLRVQLETSGNAPPPKIPLANNPLFEMVVSPKTPRVDPSVGSYAAAWKYVVSTSMEIDEKDGLPVGNPQGGGRLARPTNGAPVYLQPADEYDVAKNAANMKLVCELAMQYGHRAGVQMHKILGVP